MLVLALQFSKGAAQHQPYDDAVRPGAAGRGAGAGVLDRSCHALKDESLKTEEKIKHDLEFMVEDESYDNMSISTAPTSAPTGSVSNRVKRMLTNVRNTAP